MSIYALKPQFQSLLRPLTRALFAAGVTANQVTLCACVISIAVSLWLVIDMRLVGFWVLPVWLFLRMAFNAIDGMLAREFHQKTALGAYLNELTDVISDTFLYLPFAFLPNVSVLWVGAFIVLSIVVEMTGVVGVMVGAERRYDGPFGKSDRAFAIGALGIVVSIYGTPPHWVFPLLCILCGWTVVRRVQRGLAQIKE